MPAISLPKDGEVGPFLRGAWERLSALPGGTRVFSRLVGMAAPYTGSIGGQVQVFEPGHCVVELEDRRKVRNHLRSVHAIALMNLCEMSTGLAVSATLPTGMRGILTGLSMEYLKKARGRLRAECHCDTPEPGIRREYEVEGSIYNQEGELVAKGKAKWMIGPARGQRAAAPAPSPMEAQA